MSLLEGGALAPLRSVELRGVVCAAFSCHQKDNRNRVVPLEACTPAHSTHSDDLDLFLSFLELEESRGRRIRTVT